MSTGKQTNCLICAVFLFKRKGNNFCRRAEKGCVAQKPALDSHKSDFRHGIVNKLKNQQQITVLQLSRYYHVEARIPSHAGTVRKALRSVNFGE